jgi:aspartate-semialdehyde dehydrogenase
VIDNTAHFRRDKDIPLVVPEVNRYKLLIGKSRSSKIERIVSPTAPVAPTTQTLNFLFIKPKFENNKMNALYLFSRE